MAIEQFVNNAQTTTAGAINNTSDPVTFAVTDATKFPTTGNFRVIIDSEILLVTSVSGSNFTAKRAQEGTTIASHSSGAGITHILTAGSFYQWLSDRGMISKSLGDHKPLTPGTHDEEFEGTADTLPSGWSWNTTPSGSDEVTVNSRWPSLLTVEGNGDSTYRLSKTFIPGAIDFGIWFKVYNSPCLTADKTDLRFYLRDSARNNGVAVEHYSNGSNVQQVRLLHTVGGTESVLNPGVTLGGGQGVLYGGMTRTSGNTWRFWYSTDGIAWMFHSTSGDSFTVNFIDIQFGTANIQSLAGIDWIRYRTDLKFPRIN
jgi:hypothetical protein